MFINNSFNMVSNFDFERFCDVYQCKPRNLFKQGIVEFFKFIEKSNIHCEGDNGNYYKIKDHPRSFITNDGRKILTLSTYNTPTRISKNPQFQKLVQVISGEWIVHIHKPTDLNIHWDQECIDRCMPYMALIVFVQIEKGVLRRYTKYELNQIRDLQFMQ